MKTIKKITLILLAIMPTCFFAQTIKPTIAVANPNVNNLQNKPATAAKMMRLELIKLNQHSVLDEFDMADVIEGDSNFQSDCYGQTCLINLGQKLNVDYVMCGSLDGLGNKIAITLKMIDVKNQQVFKSTVGEYDNQELELQRMIEVLIKEMLGVPVEKELTDKLAFKNEPITSNNVGRINNSGPRIGYAYMVGSMNEFATRSQDQGGLDIFPAVSMIGYQMEAQYVGTENFSALVEGIVNVNGLEQGKFIPSITLLNGLRFGKAGWEFAFGPGFTIKKSSYGFFDEDKTFSTDGRYFSQSDWNNYAYDTYSADPQYSVNGFFTTPTPDQFNSKYNFDTKYGDTRGDLGISTMFVVAFGRTFHAGALNIPVNAFYSSQRKGGMVGVNVGFNVQKSKTPINK